MSRFTALNKTSFKELKNQVALVDFWAVWCGPCAIMEPVLEDKVAPQFPEVNFYKVDTDANQELALEFGIRSIPNMVLFRFDSDGNASILHSFIGVQDAFDMTMKIREILGNSTPSSSDAAAGTPDEASLAD